MSAAGDAICMCMRDTLLLLLLLLLLRPDASPWRLQFYRCGYQAVSGWPGWRVVVTSSGRDRAWVDLPLAGPAAHLDDYATAGGEQEEGRCFQGMEADGRRLSVTFSLPAASLVWFLDLDYCSTYCLLLPPPPPTHPCAQTCM